MIQRVKAFFLGKPGDWTSMTRTRKSQKERANFTKLSSGFRPCSAHWAVQRPTPKNNYNHTHNWVLKTVRKYIDMFPAIKAEEICPDGWTNLYPSCCSSRMICSWEKDAHFSKSVWKGTTASRSVSWSLKCARGTSKFSGPWTLDLSSFSSAFSSHANVFLSSIPTFIAGFFSFPFADALDLQHQLFSFPVQGIEPGACAYYIRALPPSHRPDAPVVFWSFYLSICQH